MVKLSKKKNMSKSRSKSRSKSKKMTKNKSRKTKTRKMRGGGSDYKYEGVSEPPKVKKVVIPNAFKGNYVPQQAPKSYAVSPAQLSKNAFSSFVNPLHEQIKTLGRKKKFPFLQPGTVISKIEPPAIRNSFRNLPVYNPGMTQNIANLEASPYSMMIEPNERIKYTPSNIEAYKTHLYEPYMYTTGSIGSTDSSGYVNINNSGYRNSLGQRIVYDPSVPSLPTRQYQNIPSGYVLPKRQYHNNPSGYVPVSAFQEKYEINSKKSNKTFRKEENAAKTRYKQNKAFASLNPDMQSYILEQEQAASIKAAEKIAKTRDERVRRRESAEAAAKAAKETVQVEPPLKQFEKTQTQIALEPSNEYIELQNLILKNPEMKLTRDQTLVKQAETRRLKKIAEDPRVKALTALEGLNSFLQTENTKKV
jgi:hypothetical protein